MYYILYSLLFYLKSVGIFYFIKLPTIIYKKTSNNLSSQQGNPQVFSAHLGLTSVFGMGTGIALNVIVTRKLYSVKHTQKYIDEIRFVLEFFFFDCFLLYITMVKPSIY